MTRGFKLASALFIVILLITVSTHSLAEPLLDYVASPEESFNWKLLKTETMAPGITVHFLEFTSQKWQGIEWKHRLNIIEPKGMYTFKLPLLFITGSGSGNDELEIMGQVANTLKMPIAILHDIPNQPLFGVMSEDAIIAYTFLKYLETYDLAWPLLVPMTKATVAAMDVIEAYAASKWNEKNLNFVVFGASKRGWTTWLTAAVDQRIKGIVPAVYDNLNLNRQMEHQIEAWGQFTEKIGDYTMLDLPGMLSSEQGQKLAKLVDPYSYLDRITMPKLIFIGTNDPYWPLDALNMYYHDLIGQKYILYVPNAGHDLNIEKEPERIVKTMSAFYLAMTGLIALPDLSWEINKEQGGIELIIESRPDAVDVDFWVAHSPTRDFRKATWSSFKSNVSEVDTGIKYYLEKPEQGWSAIYAEVHYQFLTSTFSLCSQVTLISAE